MADDLDRLARELNLVRIPAGTFLLGDRFGDGYPQERPAHEVSCDSFWAGRYAVTVGEYFEFMRDEGERFNELWCDFINPCFVIKTDDGYRMLEGAENYPMIQVGFVGAVAYCNWRSRRAGLEPVYDLETLEADPAGGGLRLLTEAEWEYACGGPRQYRYGHGDEFRPDLISHRHYSGEHKDLRASFARLGGFGLHDYSPLPVGTLPANDFGLHEMLGNVNEWCYDSYAPYPAAGGRGAAAGRFNSFRVLRGGCFLDEADKLRKSYRHGIHFHSKCMIDGFRIGRNDRR